MTVMSFDEILMMVERSSFMVIPFQRMQKAFIELGNISSNIRIEFQGFIVKEDWSFHGPLILVITTLAVYTFSRQLNLKEIVRYHMSCMAGNV